MCKVSTLFLLVGLLHQTAGDYLGLNPQGMPIYTVDLDLPPRERFKETAMAFKEEYFIVERLYLNLLKPMNRAIMLLTADAFWLTHP
jgi:hypothetical protein